MAIIVVKIGENEPDKYVRFDTLSHHGDIVQVFPAGTTTLGARADRYYLAINVDTSELDKAQFQEICEMLTESWLKDERTEQETIIAKRLRYFDISRAAFLSIETQIKIAEQTSIKRSIKPAVYEFITDHEAEFGVTPLRAVVSAYEEQLQAEFDMTTINRFDIEVPFNAFALLVINKETRRTLSEELPNAGNSI